jgi:hypothetical protein
MPEKIRDFLERRVRREIGDVVATVCEAAFLAGYAAQGGLAYDDSFETRIDCDGGIFDDARVLSARCVFAVLWLVPG